MALSSPCFRSFFLINRKLTPFYYRSIFPSWIFTPSLLTKVIVGSSDRAVSHGFSEIPHDIPHDISQGQIPVDSMCTRRGSSEWPIRMLIRHSVNANRTPGTWPIFRFFQHLEDAIFFRINKTLKWRHASFRIGGRFWIRKFNTNS